MIPRVLVAVAAVALLHAAYSAYEYLSALKALGSPDAALPKSIIIEAVAALVLFIPSIALAYEPLQAVTYRGELSKRTADDMDARMNFMRPAPRAAALFGDGAFKPSS